MITRNNNYIVRCVYKQYNTSILTLLFPRNKYPNRQVLIILFNISTHHHTKLNRIYRIGFMKCTLLTF